MNKKPAQRANLAASLSSRLGATLFYDGNCPLCQREMNILMRSKSPHLDLLDIHQQPLSATEKELMLRQLHLQLPSGQWLVGVDASVEAWRYTQFGWILKPLRWPIIGPVVDRVYRHWAERRFQRLYGGGKHLCNLPEEAANDP